MRYVWSAADRANAAWTISSTHSVRRNGIYLLIVGEICNVVFGGDCSITPEISYSIWALLLPENRKIGTHCEIVSVSWALGRPCIRFSCGENWLVNGSPMWAPIWPDISFKFINQRAILNFFHFRGPPPSVLFVPVSLRKLITKCARYDDDLIIHWIIVHAWAHSYMTWETEMEHKNVHAHIFHFE